MIKGLKISGLKELEAALRKTTLDIGRAVELAMLAGGETVATDAKRRVPVVTGELMRSIHPELGTNSIFTDGRVTVLVGTDKAYGRRIEYGFVGTDSKGRTFNQKAQPYLRPAIDENRRRVTNDVRRAVRHVIDKADTGGR